MPDNLDLKILAALQTNARKKQTELARELGVAQSTMLERIRRLEDQGVIRGYRAIIDPEKLGLHIQAFIAVTLNHHEAHGIHEFEDGIRGLAEVRACYHTTGRFDYMLHVAASDLKKLGDLVKNDIASLPSFGTSETLAVFSEIKSDEGWPINSASDSGL